jgi:hypothetical protein
VSPLIRSTFRTARQIAFAAIPDCHPPQKPRAVTSANDAPAFIFAEYLLCQVNSSRTSPYVVGYLGMFAHQRRRTCMAKGQKRSNREAKKPKKPASDKKAASPSVATIIERPSAKGGKRA